MTPRRWFVVACVLALLIGGALAPHLASPTGTMTIPNTLANLAAGNQPLSVIDTNFTAIATYVNAREVTVGVFSARPSASVAGRYYLASDVGGGTYYLDTGSSWLQVAASVTSSNFGTYSVRGLVAGTASLTVVNASASLVNLRNPSDNTIVVRSATATLSNDTLTAGPAVNGRDQSSQFAASNWIHLYYIWNGTTLGTLSSLCSPSDANSSCSQAFGPNLPSTYTHWAYIGAYRYRDNSQYWQARQTGGWITYRATPSTVNVITGGAATTETAVSVATAVPPNASQWKSVVAYLRNVTTLNLRLRVNSNVNEDYMRQLAAGTDSEVQHELNVPNVNQNFYYLWTTDPGAAGRLQMDVLGYKVPNGE